MRRLLVIASIAPLLFWAPTSTAVEFGDHASSPGQDFSIPTDDLPATEKKALAGDQRAANRLFKYYMFTKNDYQRTRFWLQIGAENGDPNSRLNLIAVLDDPLADRDTEARRQDAERLCFWVRKSLAEGIPAKAIYLGRREKCGVTTK